MTQTEPASGFWFEVTIIPCEPILPTDAEATTTPPLPVQATAGTSPESKADSKP